jgi:hypothetical protein
MPSGCNVCNYLKILMIHWSELRYLDLHRRSASVNHVVTSVVSAVSNCNTHKCSKARSIFALPNGLAEWDILKTMLRMATTGWKVLMFVKKKSNYIYILIINQLYIKITSDKWSIAILCQVSNTTINKEYILIY